MKVSVIETEVSGGYPDAVTLSLDGDSWCALIGENLQEGLAGFGTTQVEALDAIKQEMLDYGWDSVEFDRP